MSMQHLNSGSVTDTSKAVVKSGNQHHCPSRTFRCGDGSCIPEDWINDGEVDCSDLSDEKIQSATVKIFSESTEYPITIDETIDDPFDHPSVTFSSIQNRKKTSSLNRPYGCTNAMQTRVDQCSTDLIDWMKSLDQVDLANSSVLNDETR